MALPTHLQCEWKKIRMQDPGSRFWWATRVTVSVGLLIGPASSLVHGYGALGFLLTLGIFAGAILLWWVAARLYASERRRIERKVSGGWLGGWFSGWRGMPPLLLVAAVMVVGLRPTHIIQAYVMPFLVFAILVFVLELALAAKRASFELLEAREAALQARLAPHFIFNTLNTLHAQIEADPRGAQLTTERLAEVFRQVIASSDQPTIPLKQELAFVEAYLGIEQARLGDRLRVSIDIPEDLESVGIPPLSLQVIVENAVKHGVAPLEQGGDVRIGAERRGARIFIWVEDPGSGLSPLKGTGTALEVLRQRLEKPEDLEMGLHGNRHRVGFLWSQA